MLFINLLNIFYSTDDRKVYEDGRVVYEGLGESEIEARLKVAERASDDFDLIDMREFLPASKITEEEAIKLLNQLYSKFDYVFDEPEFQYSEEPVYDDDGNPYWYCLCKVYQKEEKGGGYSKREAKRKATVKMLANLLKYKIAENFDDGCNKFPTV